MTEKRGRMLLEQTLVEYWEFKNIVKWQDSLASENPPIIRDSDVSLESLTQEPVYDRSSATDQLLAWGKLLSLSPPWVLTCKLGIITIRDWDRIAWLDGGEVLGILLTEGKYRKARQAKQRVKMGRSRDTGSDSRFQCSLFYYPTHSSPVLITITPPTQEILITWDRLKHLVTLRKSKKWVFLPKHLPAVLSCARKNCFSSHITRKGRAFQYCRSHRKTLSREKNDHW